MQPSASTVHVGAAFDNFQDVKNASLKAYSIKNMFEYYILKANKDCYTITCKAKDCTWQLHASFVKESSIYRIKTYEVEDMCFSIDM